MSQIEVSGAACLSRNTIQSVIGAGRDEENPGPKLDTIADILYALQVTPHEFSVRLAQGMKDRRFPAGAKPEGRTFELAIDGHILRGEIVCTRPRKKAK